MPAVGDLVIIALLAVAVFFAVRSIRKTKKKGGCTGNCASCGCCSKCTAQSHK